MNVIFILIAVSLLVAIGFLVVFIWSIRTGQYDDEYTPSVRILFDDEVNVIEESREVDNTRDTSYEIREKVDSKGEIETRTKKPETRNP